MWMCAWVPLPGSQPPQFLRRGLSLHSKLVSPSQRRKHHVIWATSPTPGVFTAASLTGIKTGLACCIESKQRWKYLHGAEEGRGDRGQKEMEVALGCYLWGVWTVPWVSLPCPQHWSFPGFYGYADSCSLHCFYLLVTALDLWLPYILNRIKGQNGVLSPWVVQEKGQEASLLGSTMCGFSTFPHSHPSPKMKTEAVLLSREDAARWWRATTHRQGGPT